MKLLFLLLIFFVPVLLICEENEEVEEVENRSLLEETLAQDIDTASYYELLSWCRELGLGDSGGRKVLQQRLHNFFKTEQGEVPDEKTSIEIKSARETEYFTIQEIDENYILLQGDVLIELKEEESIHRIKAQKILFNQSENILTAEGDIEYVLKRGDKEELFKGQRLTFDIKSWEGVFFKGGMESEREIGDESIRFFFLGESISKLENDTVVLESGTITSCEYLENPHYKIKAKKIWVLAPDEWAIWNAVLYIGRIPVLYIPFFFHPGDDFFFHPVLGYRDREGNLLQTTTYLIGKKRRKKNAISFLAVTEQDGKEKRKIQGLFLRAVEEPYFPPKNENWSLKLLLDLYSRLGGFAGIEGDFSPHISFKGGVGISRSLFIEGGFYTPFWPDDEELYKSYWNEAWFLGLKLPFRYGLDSTWNVGKDDYRISGKFEFYSDPFFYSDFYNRTEDIDWAGMIGLDTETPIESYSGETLNLSWELNSQADLSKSISSPVFKQVSLPFFNIKLYWQSRATEGTADDPVASADPSRQFFYPVNLKLPSTSIRIGGDLLRYPLMSSNDLEAQASKIQEMPGKGFRKPEVTEKTDLKSIQSIQSIQSMGTRIPKIKEDLPSISEKKPFSFLLSYQVRPNLIVEQSFDTDQMDEQSAVSFDADYTTLETSGFSSLNYAFKLWENLLNLSGNISYSGSYRTRFNRGYENNTQWENFVRDDCLYSRFDLKTALNLALYPFQDSVLFGKSNISYNLNWIFYQYMLDETRWVYGQPIYYGLGPLWNTETVTSNTLKTRLVYQPYTQSNTLTFSASLPPKDWSFSGNLEFYVWLLKTSLNTAVNESNGSWDIQPLVINENISICEGVSLSEEIRFDLDEYLLLKSISSITLWGFSGSFTAERAVPVYFNPDEGWEQLEEEERFCPAYISTAYKLSEELFFWRNRIQLESSLNTSCSMNIQEFTESKLDFSFNLKLCIYKFLELSFTSNSYNNRIYRYLPGLTEEIGESYVNPVTDLLRSFNFFNIDDRYRSAFKLKSISVEAIHHLHDWDLSLVYTGKPVLSSEPDPQYKWESSFSILLQWIPIPEMRSRIKKDSTGLYLRG